MTKEDFIAHLKDELKEELEGICKYDALYKTAIAEGMHDEAAAIECIASDEYRHACTIKDILEYHGVDMSEHPDMKHLWEKVEEIFD